MSGSKPRQSRPLLEAAIELSASVINGETYFEVSSAQKLNHAALAYQALKDAKDAGGEGKVKP